MRQVHISPLSLIHCFQSLDNSSTHYYIIPAKYTCPCIHCAIEYVNESQSWWRYQMETRSFDVYFDLRLNKWLSKQSRRRRAHYGVIIMWSWHTIHAPGIIHVFFHFQPLLSHCRCGYDISPINCILFHCFVTSCFIFLSDYPSSKAAHL